ncbi:MAG TPA: N-6 DNA methylase, partial [Acidimicrobiales bacterium]
MTTTGAHPAWGRLAARAVAELRAAGVDDPTLAVLAIHLPLLAEPVEEATDVAEGDGERSLGELHEDLLDDDHRRRNGVHYTPASVASALVARVLGPTEGRDDAIATGDGMVPLVCDPSCGGGVFLVAVAEHLATRGADPARVLASLHGLDLDPVAVEVARVEVVAWAAGSGLHGDALVEAARGLVERVVVGDALLGPWPGEGHLQLVVGNPPFAGQLDRVTARDEATAAAARALLGGAAPGYADTAGLFLVKAALASAPGARISLIQPLSFLASRDAGVVRHRLDEMAVLVEVWVAEERVFGAAVDVCAPMLRVVDPFAAAEISSQEPAPVVVRVGDELRVAGSVSRSRLARAGSWAPVVASATGVPAVDLDDRELLGTRARATAGFRDEFYALVPFVRDLLDSVDPPDPAAPPPELPPGHAALVTAGLVEPARVLWGRHLTRFAGRRLRAPAV